MNNVINNLPTIASAAEYFDRKVGSAWRIRTAISNALMKPAFANIVPAAKAVSEAMSVVRPIENAIAAANCRPAPVNCGKRRCWRRPSQANAAPSSANTQAVACADKASGTARVAKPTASSAYDCASTS